MSLTRLLIKLALIVVSFCFLLLQASWASQANGQLMRCTPLAVWGHALCDGELAAACRADAELSHPNLVCQDASAAYCIALKHLINHPGDAHGAAGAADDWAQRSACPDVRYWLYESKAVLTGPPCDRNIGYVRWGFTHAFRALRLKLSFREGLREVLLLGGDTDTNAAIVGGMLGALHGESGIPSSMSGPVLARTCSQGIARPDWLCSSRVPKLVDQLLALSVPGPPASSTTSTSVSGRGRESLSSSSGLRDDEMPETRARRGNMFAGGQGLGFGVQCPS